MLLSALGRICRALADWLPFERATIRLWLFPPEETRVDRAIRKEGERLRKAFPQFNFDDPRPRTYRLPDDQ